MNENRQRLQVLAASNREVREEQAEAVTKAARMNTANPAAPQDATRRTELTEGATEQKANATYRAGQLGATYRAGLSRSTSILRDVERSRLRDV